MSKVNCFAQTHLDKDFLNFVLSDINTEKGVTIYTFYYVRDTNGEKLPVVDAFHNLYRDMRMQELNHKQCLALGRRVLTGDTLLPITFFHSSIYNAIVELDSIMVSLWEKDKCTFMKKYFYKENSFRDWDGDQRTAVALLFPYSATLVWDIGIQLSCFNKEDWCLKCRNPAEIRVDE